MIAGEASGDIYGGELARHLYKQLPLKITGIGGKRMRDAGVDILYDSSAISVVGFSEVFSRLKAIKEAYGKVKKILASGSINMVILIDYPGFNIKVAGIAKKMGIPVVYYIGPQIWAWRRGRIRTLARMVKKMIVILPFEEFIYKEAGLDCSFIGHPMVDETLHVHPAEETKKRYGLNENIPVVGLFPGSRIGEVKTLLPIILEAAQSLKEEKPDTQFILGMAESLEPQLLEGIISEWEKSPGCRRKIDITMIKGETNDVLNISDLVIAASGTITLQAAIFEKPMVIIYRVSPITYMIARLLVNIKDIGLINILAGKRIVPELIQKEATPENIVAEVKKIVTDRKYYEKIRKDLHEVRLKLGPPGTSERVARVIGEML